jgi:rhodanese-related sulfurtransferase
MYKKAAGLAAKKGYVNIMVFRNGIPGWVKAGYSLDKQKALPKSKVPTLNVKELKARLGNVLILDIRTPSLYKMGWIKGSVKIPLELLSKRFSALPGGKEIVVVDHAGKQVLAAGRFLKSKGYDKVYRLTGGLMAWVGQGFPLEK